MICPSCGTVRRPTQPCPTCGRVLYQPRGAEMFDPHFGPAHTAAEIILGDDNGHKLYRRRKRRRIGFAI